MPQTSSRRLQVISAQLQPALVAAASKHALPKDKAAVVVVTGAAGYVGSWLVVKLLERGHTVRACVRNLNDEAKVGFLKAMPECGGRLTLHAADMTQEGVYDEIFKGAHTVFHPAEVFMSLNPDRDMKKARADFGEKLSSTAINEHAMRASRYIVDSINKSSTVKRLIYTASIASIMPSGLKEFVMNPAIDETREPAADKVGSLGYAITKRSTEHFFTYHASISGGKWSVITGNPGDIVGPVRSPHQARETWQGKIAGILEGRPSPQEPAGRPWMLVDVRDVAEAEIRCAESDQIESGQRFMLVSGDKIHPEDIGVRIMELFPEYQCATTILPPGGQKKIVRNEPWWIRVNMRNDKVCKATGHNFHMFDDTMRATVESLVKVGGVKPMMK